ncbi:hypothetical protein GCM10028805_62630 [Spirosoma harenae]
MPYTYFIIFWMVAVLSLIAVLIYPSFQGRVIKRATVRFAKQLQQNPALSKAFAQTLHRPVDWIDFRTGLDDKNVPALLSSLPSRTGVFFIHYREWVSQDRCLLVTTVGYFRPYSSGHELFTPVYPGTRETYNLNFVIQLDAVKRQVVVLSDLYTTLVDKNLRADFAKAFFGLLPR